MSKSLSCWGWTGKRIVKNRQVVLLWGKKMFTCTTEGVERGSCLERLWN